MELLLNQLEDNIARAITLYEDLLQVTREKQEAIICADLDGLEEALNAERELIGDAARLETSRQRIHLAIARQIGIAPDELKLSRLYDAWPFHDTSRLKSAHTHLKEILQELKRVSESSIYLADISLKLIKEIRQAVFQCPQEEATYGYTGTRQEIHAEMALVDVAG
jgi:hypothetical protein